MPELNSETFKDFSDRQLLILIAEQVTQQGQKLERHAVRISKLEGWRTFLAGAWAALCLTGYVFFEYLKR